MVIEVLFSKKIQMFSFEMNSYFYTYNNNNNNLCKLLKEIYE